MQTEMFSGDKIEIQPQEIVDQLSWSGWKTNSTRDGMRKFRYATITEEMRAFFWGSWRKRETDWRMMGYHPSQWGNIWQLQQTLCMDGSVPQRAKARAQELAKEKELTFKVLSVDWIDDTVQLTTPAAKLLLPYQIPAAIRLKRALLGLPAPEGYDAPIYGGLNGNALDASDTGTGKTYVGLVVAAELGLKPCVISPLAVLPAWSRAAKFLGVSLGWVVNYDKIRTGKSGLGRWIPACMAPGAEPTDRGDFFKFEYLPGNGRHIIFFDEVQKCKAFDSKQGQILRDAARAQHKCLAISATAAKDPLEMRNLGAMLGLHSGREKDWREWCKKNGCSDTPGDRFGPKMKFKVRYSKANLAALHRQIFPLRGQRIRVADVPDFPETTIVADSLDTGHTAEINAAYEEAERLIQEATISGMTAQEKGIAKLKAMMEARIAAEKGKLDLFVELATEALEEGKHVAVFLNFRAHMDAFAKRMKSSCIIWGTDMAGRPQKPNERQDHIDAFNADTEPVITVSLQAGGAGLSLHDLHGDYPRVSLISPSFSAVDLKQALGRVHRAGAKTKSWQRIIFAAGTVEDEICASMRVKLGNIETLNDGDLTPGGVAEKIKEVILQGEQKTLL